MPQENRLPKPDPIGHPCSNCSHYTSSVWQPIAKGSVSTLAHSFVRKDLAKGEVLFEQGSQSRGVFCVSRGLFSLRSYHPNGSSTLLKLAYPGDLIGFRAFLRNGGHRTEARALMPSRVCTVARRVANQVIEASPMVLSRLVARCIDDMDQSQSRIAASTVFTNRERLADLLLALLEKHGDTVRSTTQMRLPVSRQDIADMLGVQPETLSRLMRKLERDGLISVSGRIVVVHSLPALRDTALGVS